MKTSNIKIEIHPSLSGTSQNVYLEQVVTDKFNVAQ